MSKRKIFYILPCYNESLNLDQLLTNFTNFYNSKPMSIVIIIVDDGSIDNSIEIINKFKRKINYKNISIKILKDPKLLKLNQTS